MIIREIDGIVINDYEVFIDDTSYDIEFDPEYVTDMFMELLRSMLEEAPAGSSFKVAVTYDPPAEEKTT